MKIGTTSFAFRNLLLNTQDRLDLMSLVSQAENLQIDRLQICENAYPLSLSDQEWNSLVLNASFRGVDIRLGCKTLDFGELYRFMIRAASMPHRQLRLVLEDDSHSIVPTDDVISKLLEDAMPFLESHDVRLAIENHFDIPSTTLKRIVERFPRELVGFCVDTANSLRNFESPETVLALLGERAFCFHLKDYSIEGHVLGFAVRGAPLGRGRLDIDHFLRIVLSFQADAEIYLENWVPATGDADKDIAEDDRWLRESLKQFQIRFGSMAKEMNI
jgi:hypothetical protein